MKIATGSIAGGLAGSDEAGTSSDVAGGSDGEPWSDRWGVAKTGRIAATAPTLGASGSFASGYKERAPRISASLTIHDSLERRKSRRSNERKPRSEASSLGSSWRKADSKLCAL